MRGKRLLWKKLGIAALISIFVLIVLTYIAISLYFENHYYYHTMIGGEDMGYKTPMEVEELLYSRMNDYVLEIYGREDAEDVIVPTEIDMHFLIDDALIKIKKEQRPEWWILGFFQEHHYSFPWKAVYDKEALERRIGELVFFQAINIRSPKDAYITYSNKEKEYVIVEADPGTQIEKEKTEKAIEEALEALERKIDLEEKGCYKVAKIEEENKILAGAKDKANKYMQPEITYNWNGSEVFVDADMIHDWVIIDGNTVRLDEEKIGEFVAEQAQKYDTYGKNRIFHTTDGREIELKSGAYGWKTDRDAEKEELIRNLQKGEAVKREPVYSYTAAQPGDKDIGDTYVEIDLGKQHLYLYVEKKMVLESDFVSGNASRGWNTPAGVFGLTYKTKNAVLRGPGYETPVNFWMPFNGNIGMHDATWRSSFGGEIYLTNGSHGCINLPYENAKIIYEYVYTGFPVVCYY